MTDVAEALARVRARIAVACARAGRPPDTVRLVAVGKGHDVGRLRAAVEVGQPDLAENYAQELARKAEALGALPIRWHFVGRLQRNKCRILAPIVDVVHSIDDASTAEELGRRVVGLGRLVDVLVQVNLSGEATKAGCRPEHVQALVDRVRAIPGLRVVGLMTLPPPTPDPEQSRPWFRALTQLARTHGLGELSMGMSDDLEVAVEEGATMVRVGTALFGPRPKDMG
ncbi:MAG: YggS family pyridoxal phosphate-dependent enzyme [Myxococcota bacterium]|nr:YggS family pyridoxal phosphate-dependent enzyme [Myxococcota bacterium]MDW8361539.1 YggS family pyridoxal phosphate-dependent enzyme [Myxococcales bacterium]